MLNGFPSHGSSDIVQDLKPQTLTITQSLESLPAIKCVCHSNDTTSACTSCSFFMSLAVFVFFVYILLLAKQHTFYRPIQRRCSTHNIPRQQCHLLPHIHARFTTTTMMIYTKVDFLFKLLELSRTDRTYI